MPPIRRYVRISQHSLLEVRIFLENPADTTRWLLARNDPALPKVFEAVQPLILPKLREERERTALTKGKGKKGKSVKDVVDKEDFRVVVFLTEGGTRHEVAVKLKTARENGKQESTRRNGTDKESTKGRSTTDAVVIRDEDEGDDVNLADLPVASDDDDDNDNDMTEIASRKRDDEDDNLPSYRDDKKKLGFSTRYEGFSIWGKVLCLLVERKGGATKKAGAAEGNEGAQKVMQEWISSTQVGAEEEDD